MNQQENPLSRSDLEKATQPTPNPTEPHDSLNQVIQRLAAIYKLPADATGQDVLKAALELEDRMVQEEADERLIAAKMDKGLSRTQAVAVIERQRVHDKTLKEEREKRLPALLQIISKNQDDLRTARRLAIQDGLCLEGSEWNAALEAFNQLPPGHPGH